MEHCVYFCFSSGVFSCRRLLAVNHCKQSWTLEPYAWRHLDMRTISKTIHTWCIVEYMATDFSKYSTFEEAQLDALVQILTCGSNGWRTMDTIVDLGHVSGKFNNKTKQFKFSYFGPTIFLLDTYFCFVLKLQSTCIWENGDIEEFRFIDIDKLLEWWLTKEYPIQ